MTKEDIDRELELFEEYMQKDMLEKVTYAIMQLEAFGYQWCKERAADLKEVKEYLERGN